MNSSAKLEYEKGQNALNANQPLVALRAFWAAYKLDQQPEFLYDAAYALLLLKRYRWAQQTYAFFGDFRAAVQASWAVEGELSGRFPKGFYRALIQSRNLPKEKALQALTLMRQHAVAYAPAYLEACRYLDQRPSEAYQLALAGLEQAEDHYTFGGLKLQAALYRYYRGQKEAARELLLELEYSGRLCEEIRQMIIKMQATGE